MMTAKELIAKCRLKPNEKRCVICGEGFMICDCPSFDDLQGKPLDKRTITKPESLLQLG